MQSKRLHQQKVSRMSVIKEACSLIHVDSMSNMDALFCLYEKKKCKRLW